ncbi:MAG TPA: NAD(P)-dependent alcohol dehydrogenase [Candidatus Polarisedimenticolaceae bacterium]|nr:NAD(P)-dependent alcohol dehydrogenase [Candidatus Polarisedimenticolaceae bacterium]
MARRGRGILRRLLRWAGIALGVGLILGSVAFALAYFRSDNVCDEPGTFSPAHPMRAVVYCAYGPPDVLRVEHLEKPVPKDTQLLVKVHAASINPLDWHVIRGTPYFMRMMAGLRKPKEIQLGVDFAGTVEAVGSKVTRFKPGDAVFGGRDGAFAEYLTVGEDKAVAAMPTNITFQQAAGIGVAGITALQALRDRAEARPGLKILINGASGGVGTFAVQIAKARGAHVTGVCSTRNVEMVRALGADEVIDYKKEDFTKGDRKFDVILDNVGNRSLAECRRALVPDGKYILIGGGGPQDQGVIGPMWKVAGAALKDRFVSQDMGFFMANMNGNDLAALADLIQSGRVSPVVDREYALDRVQEAVGYVEEGHARGKVVLTMDSGVR